MELKKKWFGDIRVGARLNREIPLKFLCEHYCLLGGHIQIKGEVGI